MKKSLFNRKRLAFHRNRVYSKWFENAYIKYEASKRLNERINELNKSFDLVLDLGSHSGEISSFLIGNEKIKCIIQSELAIKLAEKAKIINSKIINSDEEALPFKANIFNAVISSMSLHWINDLNNLFKNIRVILKSDGLILMNFLGGETLNELRKVLISAETEILGGTSLRVSPFLDIKTAGSVLQSSGFTMPVVDIETIVVTHQSIFNLFRDLRFMAETSCIDHQLLPLRRDVLKRADEIYKNKFSTLNNRIESTFELITMVGWK